MQPRVTQHHDQQLKYSRIHHVQLCTVPINIRHPGPARQTRTDLHPPVQRRHVQHNTLVRGSFRCTLGFGVARRRRTNHRQATCSPQQRPAFRLRQHDPLLNKDNVHMLALRLCRARDLPACSPTLGQARWPVRGGAAREEPLRLLPRTRPADDDHPGGILKDAGEGSGRWQHLRKGHHNGSIKKGCAGGGWWQASAAHGPRKELRRDAAFWVWQWYVPMCRCCWVGVGGGAWTSSRSLQQPAAPRPGGRRRPAQQDGSQRTLKM